MRELDVVLTRIDERQNTNLRIQAAMHGLDISDKLGSSSSHVKQIEVTPEDEELTRQAMQAAIAQKRAEKRTHG